ncbi:hypothetical protein WN943_013842 [Citrus x changshan-huyou]
MDSNNNNGTAQITVPNNRARVRLMVSVPPNESDRQALSRKRQRVRSRCNVQELHCRQRASNETRGRKYGREDDTVWFDFFVLVVPEPNKNSSLGVGINVTPLSLTNVPIQIQSQARRVSCRRLGLRDILLVTWSAYCATSSL